MTLFADLHNKDAFFEALTSDEDIWPRIANQYALLVLCSALYGVVMGSYNGLLQAMASGLKVPLLFSLALLICFPAFFMVQHVLGSKLGFWAMLAVILSGFVMIALIMASFSFIVIFFLITADNYAFLKLLHVAIFALAGAFGMKTILDGLRFCCEKKGVYPRVGVLVFRVWMVILAFVGMQLAWNLRPFIGNRNLPFEWFRTREGNFYLAVFDAAGRLVDPRTSESPEPNAPAQP
jgi:hypothetical protein